MPPHDTEQARWFSLEVQPHEPALRAYLQARFPLLRDSDDVVQETYKRVLREKDTGKIRHIRAFMFTAARNLALDFFRQRHRAPADAIAPTSFENLPEEAPNAVETLCRQQDLEVLAEAVKTLPERCRQVIVLRYVKGCSYKEIAAMLDVSVETVKTHMAKGVKRCADHFEERGLLENRSFPAELPT